MSLNKFYLLILQKIRIMKVHIFSLAFVTLALAGTLTTHNASSAENLLKFETADGVVLHMYQQETGEIEEPLPPYVRSQMTPNETMETMPCLNLSFKDFLMLIRKPEQEDPLPFDLG